MKTSYLSVVIGLLLPAVSFAEGGGGNEDWAEKAAVGYEEKAAKATADGNAADATIYLRMAQIKRDAGAAAKAGKEFSWDEYHALSGQLSGGVKFKGGKGKDTEWKKSDDKKAEHKDKSHDKEAKADKKGKENPGDGFIGAAQEYQKLSIEAAKVGDADQAGIYAELAKIKLEAAAAANQGKEFDWTKYQELKGKLEE